MTGVPVWLLPLLAAFVAGVPTRAWPWPSGPSRLWLLPLCAGAFAAWVSTSEQRCPAPEADQRAVVRGRFLASPRAGSAPFERTGGCEPVTMVVDAPEAPAGRMLEVEGRWREGSWSFWFQADDVRAVPRAEDAGPRWMAVRWRDRLLDRIEGLYGARAPFVAALTLARREGFDRDLREDFTRSGLAHLLAISGFHVGVIAALLFAVLRSSGLRARTARLAAGLGVWAYVALIGFPDAASRAALILTFVALSRARGRPPARWGALASALLVLVALDPGRVASAGFQLSFAGSAGLLAWAGPLARALRKRFQGRVPEPVVVGVAASAAATLATLPIVAWHFEQVSLVGIPATLVAGPIVALALPGAIASIAIDFLSHDLAVFLAGGVSTLLDVLASGATEVGSRPWVTLWATRGSVVAMVVGGAVATHVARRPWIGVGARRALMSIYFVVGVLAWPVLVSIQGRGTAELLTIDVGQGDATAIRSPGGRWVLVDAGRPAEVADPRGHPVVRALRARGVRSLDAMILTHADLDHIGGAEAVLQSFPVGAVYDPGLAAGKEEFVEVLEMAARRDVPWLVARAGTRLELGRVEIEVLSPTDSMRAAGVETNEGSVVLMVRHGAFDALLTGDAYKPVERRLAALLGPDIEVLKVGHHGSDTSTDPALLDGIRPELALISVGRSNRYGHPAPEVLERLRARAIDVRRTDRDGSISVLGRPDGRFTLSHGGR
ncbi:MAG: DNA internalization-related competence protein ComEC/Rec2 [Gemmatimonadota bacterium]|nr:DNA internalization-related competence protein ComEC/Rec2 [Gemmatimonadota bacterium]